MCVTKKRQIWVVPEYCGASLRVMSGAMPTALRGHGWAVKTCPRKAVGMAPTTPSGAAPHCSGTTQNCRFRMPGCRTRFATAHEIPWRLCSRIRQNSGPGERGWGAPSPLPLSPATVERGIRRSSAGQRRAPLPRCGGEGLGVRGRKWLDIRDVTVWLAAFARSMSLRERFFGRPFAIVLWADSSFVVNILLGLTSSISPAWNASLLLR